MSEGEGRRRTVDAGITVEAEEAETGGGSGAEGIAISPCATKPLKLATESLRFGPAHGLRSYDLPSDEPMSASEADEDERCGRCEPLPLMCRAGVVDAARGGGCVSARVGCAGIAKSARGSLEKLARLERTSPNDARLLLACGALPTMKLLRARGDVARAG